MQPNTEEQLTLLQVDSLARTCQLPENKLGFKVKEAPYIGKCLELLASVCRDTQFLKTSQDSLLESLDGGLDNFSMTWTRSGSMQNGIVSRLPTLAHRTIGIESGLLPTLGKNEGKGASRNRYRGSTDFRGAKMAEGLRSCQSDPIYTHPNFAEAAMGFPRGWTDLQD
tara:strand:- start:55 stop:558 length:504 start_codon:yes stop_codon:yes gene_type:complete